MTAPDLSRPRLYLADIGVANARGERQRAAFPPAVAARHVPDIDRIVVALASGIELALRPALIQGLAGAAPADLAEIDLSPTGHGLRFPRLDVDLHLPGLLHGRLGNRHWMAVSAGLRRGMRRSEARAAAARANGRRRRRPLPAPDDQPMQG